MAKIEEKVKNIAENIETMEIRGAGKIARSVARGLKIQAENSKANNAEEFYDEMIETTKILYNTRPSAVSLPNALRHVMNEVRTVQKRQASLEKLRNTTINTAEEFIKNSNEAVKEIGRIGANRIQEKEVIMTHCHSSAATSVIRKAHKEGKIEKVYVKETRPRYQGRITAQELAETGMQVELIVDGAARHFMKKVDKVIIGADSIAANGAVINKIGTADLGLVADEQGSLLMVAAETYKFHPETISGEMIKIEERDIEEVVPEDIRKDFPENLKIRNPAFDALPPEYINVIVTENGIIPPQSAPLILRDAFGWKIKRKEPWET